MTQAHQGKQIEIAHILHKHIGAYSSQYHMSLEHKKIVSDLLACRSPHLGGRVERCDTCGTLRITYYSCRNRHCPKCQHMPRESWLEKRKNEILPVKYFHVVFTLPHELNATVLNNKRLMLNCLFEAASKTLLRFGKQELNGKMGFLALLHSWDQKLHAHFHLHCLVPGGVISQQKNKWLPCPKNYLFNQRALSLVFRTKFMQLIDHNRKSGALHFNTDWYLKLKNTLYNKNWVVSVRDPVKRPEHVLDYLARYTHRVAITNTRIKSLDNGMVTFRAKNRKKNRTDSITISAVEFIRRFLLHCLPAGFVRIRHYGFLANRNRKTNLSAIRALLGLSAFDQNHTSSIEELIRNLTGIDITICPCCNKGKMRLILEIPIYRARDPTCLIPSYAP